jgi:hypothetical protein
MVADTLSAFPGERIPAQEIQSRILTIPSADNSLITQIFSPFPGPRSFACLPASFAKTCPNPLLLRYLIVVS